MQFQILSLKLFIELNILLIVPTDLKAKPMLAGLSCGTLGTVKSPVPCWDLEENAISWLLSVGFSMSFQKDPWV